MTIIVSCSELRLFQISPKLWVKCFVLGESEIFTKGLILHKICENDFEVTNEQKQKLDYNDLQKIKKIKSQIDKIGKLLPGVMIKKDEFSLKGKPDGIINGTPVEIKFNDYRKEDEMQALGYALLYNSKQSYLIYPNNYYFVELTEEKKQSILDTVKTIKQMKKILLRGSKNDNTSK